MLEDYLNHDVCFPIHYLSSKFYFQSTSGFSLVFFFFDWNDDSLVRLMNLLLDFSLIDVILVFAFCGVFIIFFSPTCLWYYNVGFMWTYVSVTLAQMWLNYLFVFCMALNLSYLKM